MVWVKMRRGTAILESPMTLMDLIQHDPECGSGGRRREGGEGFGQGREEEEVTRGDRRRRRRRRNDGELEGGDGNVVGGRWGEEGDKEQMMWKM